MDRYPVLAAGEQVGEMTVRREKLYTAFEVSCRMREGLWCAWAVGETGTLRIGVMEPEDGRLRICRRFSQESTGPLGPLSRGELRVSGAEREQWELLDGKTPPFSSPCLLRCLRGRRDVLFCETAGRRLLAFPRDDQAPFPLERMFCFAQLREVRGTVCWVFAFDDREWPVL